MKKIVVAILAITMLFAFVSCDDSSASDDAIISVTFDRESDAELFCPEYASTIKEEEKEAKHEGFKGTFVVENGKAAVYGNSAYIELGNVSEFDWSKDYKLTYTVALNTEYTFGNVQTTFLDLLTGVSNPSTPHHVIFTGNATDGIKVSICGNNDLSDGVNDEHVTSVSEGNITVEVVFSMDGDELTMTTTVRGGEKEISDEFTVTTDDALMRWMVYAPTEKSDTSIAYIDDFRFEPAE